MKEDQEIFGIVSAEVEAFFSQIATVLVDFSSSHNLKIERYYHDSPSWRLNFMHPNGGFASIEVLQESSDTIKIYDYCWLDDYEQFARFLRTEETAPFELDSVDLNETLREHLEALLSWRRETLINADIDYEPYWKPHLETLININYDQRYPEPKP